LKGGPYGPVIGRYANRIAKAQFTLDGKTYTLAKNNGENHIHGGLKGFAKVVWKAEPFSLAAGEAVKLRYLSRDGEEGYPGNLEVTVTYTLTPRNELRIDYAAATDKETVINLTNHSYFNLAGSGNVLNHDLYIDADRFTPVDNGSIPTGELQSVKGTYLDFTQPAKVGARLGQPDPQLRSGKGYDHNFVINRRNNKLTLAAKLFAPESGRLMEVWTTEPGVQLFYSGRASSSSIGKGGEVQERNGAVCLETQHYPDSPNHPSFPSTELKPGKKFASTTIYKFSVADSIKGK
jgi:aldose 1-epimerase